MPTLPLHNGCSANQTIVSCPSLGSSRNGKNVPSEANRPRQSCVAERYPCWAKKRTSSVPQAALLYGVRNSTAGNLASAGRPFSAGTYRSVANFTPSPIGTITSLSTTTSPVRSPALAAASAFNGPAAVPPSHNANIQRMQFFIGLVLRDDSPRCPSPLVALSHRLTGEKGVASS